MLTGEKSIHFQSQLTTQAQVGKVQEHQELFDTVHITSHSTLLTSQVSLFLKLLLSFVHDGILVGSELTILFHTQLLYIQFVQASFIVV